MDIRLLTSKEFPHAQDLWDYCFEKKGSPFFEWYFSKYCKAENVLGAFDKDDFAGMIHLNPYMISLHGKNIPLAYFVGVATSPEKRGQGVLPRMTKKAFYLLREKGQCISLLMPVMAGIYQPYGFSFCYNKLKYDIPLRELSSLFKNTYKYTYELINASDITILQSIYKKAMAGYNGYAIRSLSGWQAILDDLSFSGGNIVIVRDNEDILGYMLYFIKDNAFNVLEMIALENHAKEAMLYFAAQHLSQCEDFKWLAPENDLTYLKFKEYDFCPVLRPFMMGRIIDAEKAVNELQFFMQEGQSVAIELSDSVIEENNGVFVLKEIDGRAYMYRDESVLADAKMDIGTFAQLCFGTYDVNVLHKAGFIHADSKAAEMLEKIFAKKKNYINEYF